MRTIFITIISMIILPNVLLSLPNINWEIVYIKNSSYSFSDFAIEDGIIYAVNSYSTIGKPQVTISSDRGKNWTDILPDSIAFLNPENHSGEVWPRAISVSGPRILASCTSKSDGYYIYSSDYGKTWVRDKLKHESNGIGFALTSEDGFSIVGGYFGFSIFTDYMQNRRDIDIIDTNRLNIFGFSSVGPDYLLMLAYLEHEGFKFLVSTDRGQSWEKHDSPYDGAGTVFCLNKDNWWGIPAKYFGNKSVDMIVHTSNAGDSWETSLLEERINKSRQFDIYFADSLNGISVGRFGRMYLTHDGGKTWSREYMLDSTDWSLDLNCVIIDDNGEIYVGTNRGMIFKGSSILGIEEKQEKQYRIYPNPAGKGETITIIIEDDQFIASSWSLFDIEGKLTAQGQIINSGKKISVQLPGDIPAGNYFIKLFNKLGTEKYIQFQIE